MCVQEFYIIVVHDEVVYIVIHLCFNSKYQDVGFSDVSSQSYCYVNVFGN
jgi:hypothetical protein